MRFRLQLPVVFSWLDENGKQQIGEGCSRDLSSGGVRVNSENVPPVGASVEMNVCLPQPGWQIAPAELHARGRVVRVDVNDHEPADLSLRSFAVKNDRIVMRDPMLAGEVSGALRREAPRTPNRTASGLAKRPRRASKK